MLTKKELLALWKECDFRAVKKLGQNFLIDANVKDKLVAFIGPSSGDCVLEIGPGFGELTVDVAAAAGSVTAVEKDARLIAILRSRILPGRPNVEVVNADFLDFDTDGRFTKIIGNLPYYVTTPIIEKALCEGNGAPLYFMVQDEYAARLLARPGEEDYSSLTCFVNYRASVTRLMTVGKKCFFPEPKVESCFVKLQPLSVPPVRVSDEALFNKIIRRAFQQKRKTVRSSMCGQRITRMSKDELGSALEALGFRRDVRPEEMSIADFAKVADLLKKRG